MISANCPDVSNGLVREGRIRILGVLLKARMFCRAVTQCHFSVFFSGDRTVLLNETNHQAESKSHQWFGATVRSHDDTILVRATLSETDFVGWTDVVWIESFRSVHTIDAPPTPTVMIRAVSESSLGQTVSLLRNVFAPFLEICVQIVSWHTVKKCFVFPLTSKFSCLFFGVIVWVVTWVELHGYPAPDVLLTSAWVPPPP